MNKHLEIHRLARQQGKDLSKLSESEYFMLSLQVRTAREIVHDGARAVASTMRQRLGRIVPEAVLNQRRETCRANRCGSYQRLGKTGSEVCHRCNCAGKRLEAKWANPNEECPYHPPLWGRYTGLTVNLEEIQ